MNGSIALRAPLLSALVFLSACGADSSEGAGHVTLPVTAPALDPISVSIGRVTRETVVSPYSTSATLRADRQATVTSRTRGVLEELRVEEGEAVTAGQVIAKLEDDEQTLAVERTETVREIKLAEYERSKKLNEQQILSNNDVELLRRESEDARHDMELARLNFARTSIVAPFDGIVVLRHLDVGATVSDGTPIYDLADLDPLYVDVNVPERHVGRLAPRQAVRLFADTLDAPVEAAIERIAPVVDPATGTVKVTVAVASSVVLRPGAFVEVDIVTDIHEDALVVPRSALVAEGRRWVVFRVAANEKSVQALEVELGFEEGERVEIASSTGDRPLAAGDSVVVLGASALSDGALIQVLQREFEDTEEPELGEADASTGDASTAGANVAAADSRD